VPKFDVAIVGAGIAGLSIAALVSKAGRTVVLTEPFDRAGGAVVETEKDGFHFSAGPNAVYGLEQGGTLNKLLAALDMADSVPVRPARYQVLLPDRRITISPVQQDTLEELRREYPHEIDLVAAAYRDAGKLSRKGASSRISFFLTARRSASSFLRKYRFSSELMAYFAVQAHYFFGQGLDTLPLTSLALMMSTAPAEFPGGYARLAAQIASRGIGRSGTIVWNEPWPILLYRHRRASGISTSQGTMEARSVIINADCGISEQVLFLGIRDEVLPVRMENTVLCVSDYRRPEEYFSLAVAPPGTNAPANMRALAAAFPVADSTPAERGVLLDRLQSVMPFLNDSIITEDIRQGEVRRFPTTEPIRPRIIGPSSAQHVSRKRTFKNVLIVPDSSRFLLTSARSARMVAAQLT